MSDVIAQWIEAVFGRAIHSNDLQEMKDLLQEQNFMLKDAYQVLKSYAEKEKENTRILEKEALKATTGSALALIQSSKSERALILISKWERELK